MNDALDRLFKAVAANEVLVPKMEQAALAGNWPREFPIRCSFGEHKSDGYFHPSSDCTLTPLQLYYKHSKFFDNPSEKFGANTMMNFIVGTAFHAVVQSMMIHVGLTEEQYVEVPFKSEERHCSGTVDVSKVFVEGDPLVDIKSAMRLPAAVSEGYDQQLQIYLDLGPTENRDHGYILYLSKSTPHTFKEFRVERNTATLDSIYRKWDTVHKALEAETEGPQDHRFSPCCSGPTLKRCPAKEICRQCNTA